MLNAALLILRIALGIVFVAHGLQKSFGVFSGPGINGFTQYLSGLGFVPAVFWAYVAAYTELVGGICVLLGLFTRIASALIFILLVVATVRVHLTHGFFGAAGGFEYNLVLLCICIVLMLLGAGTPSITKKL